MDDISRRDKEAVQSLLRHPGWTILRGMMLERQRTLANRVAFELGDQEASENSLIVAGRVRELSVMMEFPTLMVGEQQEQEEETGCDAEDTRDSRDTEARE